MHHYDPEDDERKRQLRWANLFNKGAARRLERQITGLPSDDVADQIDAVVNNIWPGGKALWLPPPEENP